MIASTLGLRWGFATLQNYGKDRQGIPRLHIHLFGYIPALVRVQASKSPVHVTAQHALTVSISINHFQVIAALG